MRLMLIVVAIATEALAYDSWALPLVTEGENTMWGWAYFATKRKHAYKNYAEQ